jgi:hypothetical protein
VQSQGLWFAYSAFERGVMWKMEEAFLHLTREVGIFSLLVRFLILVFLVGRLNLIYM